MKCTSNRLIILFDALLIVNCKQNNKNVGKIFKNYTMFKKDTNNNKQKV